MAPFLVILPDASTRNTPPLPVLEVTLEDELDLMLDELTLETLDTLDLLLDELTTLATLDLLDDEIAIELEETLQPFTTP